MTSKTPNSETPAEAAGRNGTAKPQKELEAVTIRFGGDSGDGVQLTGGRFTSSTALAGNDLSTFPDFPAEIRAPVGTVAGVSGFQIRFSSEDILTPGDAPDVLVAFNPAALKANLRDLPKGATIIANSDAFTPANIKKATLTGNPLSDGSLANYVVIEVPMSMLTSKALEGLNLTPTQASRCKNFFALGIMLWLYDRSLESTVAWIQAKFKKIPLMVEANKRVLLAGHAFAETAELFGTRYRVRKAPIEPGRYRNITGNDSLALGLIAASQLSGHELFYGSYPITPASDILHALAKHKAYGIKTFQAEDEIAAVCASIGASFAGDIGVTGTSGPGLALKGEAIGLAVMTELPLVIVNVQRGGPSTGLPTKTEQADLMQALYGRNGESPVAVVAPATPSDCFAMAVEACRIAMTYRVPVILLSDGYLGNGSEPWRIPNAADLPKIEVSHDPRSAKDAFLPYAREEGTLARPWVVPGTPGYEHRIGGLEKAENTGNVSYDPENHERMTKIRAEKVARIADGLPPTEVVGDRSGDVLILGWGSTYGSITTAVRALRAQNKSVSSVHVRHLNPLPNDLGEILSGFKRVLVPELNLGQLVKIVRGRYMVPAVPLNKVQGRPFMVSEITEAVDALLKEARS